jgi:hypothetical protein
VNGDDAGKWWVRMDGPNGGPRVIQRRTVGTTYSLSGWFLRALKEWIRVHEQEGWPLS